MSIIKRFSTSARGAMIFTGNTLGLSRNNSDIRVFTTLDLSKQEPGYPNGTTDDWRENGSSAKLNIPEGSKILYAELQWGGSSISGGDNVRRFIDNSIIFTNPLGSSSIISDSSTAQEISNGSTEFYSRSQDVTNLISGSGTYSVEGVPATISGPNNTAGWTLGVIYEEKSLPVRSMNIYSGIEVVSANLGDIDINLTGFFANPIGLINGRVLISAMDGEEQIKNDQVFIGPDLSSLVALSGPNNLVDNFFRSFINNGNSESPLVGQLDTTGSFGDINPPDKPARYGWDITNVEANNFVNSQSLAVMRLRTKGDGYAVPLIGIQLDTVFTDFGDAPDKDTSTQGVGNYRTLFLSNGPRHLLINELIIGSKVTGEKDAYQNSNATGDDIEKGIQDDGTLLPLTNMALNDVQYTISLSLLNNTGITANLYAWLDFNRNGIFETNEGITELILSSPSSQSLALNFNIPEGVSLTAGPTIIRVRLTTENLVNTGGIIEEDTRSFGEASDGEVEDYELIIENTIIDALKSVDKAFSDLNEIITYTVNLSNPGTLPIDNFVFQDPVPSGTTYANALFVSTSYTGINPQSGLTISRINPGEIVIISWQVQVGSLVPTSNPIENIGNIFIDRLPVINSNTVLTRVNNIQLTPVKAVDKTIATIGEELLYTITISAVGSVPANNLVISDSMSTDVSYIPGSLISNVPITGNLIDGISTVNSVNDGETIIITYKVRIDSLPTNRVLDNKADITYEYILEITEPPVVVNKESNVVSTTISIAEFSGEKSVDKAFAEIGEELLYTIRFTNSGDIQGENVVIVDFIESGTSYIEGSISGNVPFAGDPTSKINLLNPVLVSETIEISYRVRIDFIPSTNPIPNIATINYEYFVVPTEPPRTDSRDTNRVFTQVNDPRIEVSKSVDKNFIEVNEAIEYTINITNTGDVDASNIVIRDQFPSGLGYTVLDINSNAAFLGGPSTQINIVNPIAPGESIFVTYRVLVDSLPVINPIANTANIDFQYIVNPSEQPRISRETTNTVLTQVNSGVLNGMKKVDKSVVNVGETIEYTITITNMGNINAQNIQILDTLPIGTSYVPESIIGTIPFIGNPTSTINLINPIIPGGIAIISFNLLIDVTAPSEISNIATINFQYLVDPSEPLRSGTVNTNVVRTEVNSLGETTIKSVNKAFATVGEEIDYTIIFINTNMVNAENVVITDLIESGTSYIIGSISGNIPFTGDPNTQISLTNPVLPNEEVNISYSILVNSIPSEDPLPNSAYIDYEIPPISINTKTNTVTTKINLADLNPLLSVNKNFVELKGTLEYTVTFTNLGNSQAFDIIMIDFIPEYTAYLDGTVNVNLPFTGAPNTSIRLTNPLLPGESVFISYKVEVEEIPPTDNITNNMTIDYNYIVDPLNPSVNVNKISNTVNTMVNSVELESIKSVDKVFAEVLEEIKYTINITNLGNIEASKVEILDRPPEGTSYVAGTIMSNVAFTGNPTSIISLTNPILPEESIFISYNLRIDKIPEINPISNTATIKFEEIVNPSEPPVSESVDTNRVFTKVNSASLNLLKAVDKDFAEIGEKLTYTIKFTNTGNVSLENVIVTDIIPEGTSYVPETVFSNVDFSGDPRTSINILNSVGTGETITIMFMVIIKEIPLINPIENIGSIAYEYVVDPSKPSRSGNRDTNSVFTQINAVDLIGSKFVDKGFAEIGEILSYKLTFTNNGNIDASNIIITDSIPEGFSYLVDSINSNVSFTGDPRSTINLLNPIGPSEQVVINFKFLVESIPPINPDINVASINFDYIVNTQEPARNEIENTNEVFTKINSPEIDSLKTVDKPYAEVGEELEYTIRFTNTGNVLLRNIFLSDQIPVGTEYVLFSLTSTVPIEVDRENFTATLINPVEPGEIVIITYKVSIEFFPPINPMPNTASIRYDYIVDISQPPRTRSESTNTAFTQINFALIEPRAIVDKSFVEPGGEVEYILTFENVGNVNANDIFVSHIIPAELSYIDNTVSANVSFMGDPIEGMSLLNPLAKNEEVEIKFKVLASDIDGIRTAANGIRTVIMSSNVEYSYFVDPSGSPINVDADSNEVFITIKSIEVEFIKESNKSTVGLGGEIIYTLRMRNSGDGELFNIIIRDIIQSETTYINNSLSSNVPFAGSSPSEITLTNSLNPGEEAVINFSVSIDSIPGEYIINNIANGEYAFFLNPEELPITENINSNIVNVIVQIAIIHPIGEDGNTPILQVGDEFCFTGQFINIGNVDAENVVIKSIISEEFSYVEESLEVDVEFTGDPVNGINLVNPVSPEEIIEFTFCLLIEEVPNQNPSQVTYIVDYEYRVLSEENPIKDVAQGNRLNVFVNPVVLIKECFPSEVSLSDFITYTFSIINTGDEEITDILFYDNLPEGFEFVEGSFIGVDDENITSESFDLGIPIKNIPPKTSKEFSFKVMVIGAPCSDNFENIGHITFQAQFEGEIRSLEAFSNSCDIPYKSICFKQDYLDGIIELDSSMKSIKEITDFNVSFVVESYNIELLNKKTILDNGIVIGKSLNINGKFVILITYIDEEFMDINNLKEEVCVCFQLKLPLIEICQCHIDISMDIEDSYYKKIDIRKIFYNITYLIESGL